MLIDLFLASAVKPSVYALLIRWKPIQGILFPCKVLVAYHEKMHLFYNKGAKQLATSVLLIKLEQSLTSSNVSRRMKYGEIESCQQTTEDGGACTLFRLFRVFGLSRGR